MQAGAGESWAPRWEERMGPEPVGERIFSPGPVFADSGGCSEICLGNRPTRKPWSATFFLLLPVSWCTVFQSLPTLCDSVDYTVHGILQARILEWVAVPFSREGTQALSLDPVLSPSDI